MINWKLYEMTNFHENYRLKELEFDRKASLDRVIKWLTFITLIAFVVFKERV